MTAIYISLSLLAVMSTGILGIVFFLGWFPRGAKQLSLALLPIILGSIGLYYLFQQLQIHIAG